MRPAGPAPTTITSLIKLEYSSSIICEYCDVTSILPDDLDSVPSARPGAIFCRIDDGGLSDVDRELLKKLNIEDAIL
jgi:hypothetical protein